jgi:hypothetical protein
MEDSFEQLIRRAVGRRPSPRPGPKLVEDVVRRVAIAERAALERGRARARRRLAAAIWLPVAAASVAVLANVEWSSASRTLAWGFGLLLVPMTYSATLWLAGACLPAGTGEPRRGRR